MRSLATRLRFHAATDKAFDLKMAAELMEHLPRLTTKLARPADSPLGSAIADQWPVGVVTAIRPGS